MDQKYISARAAMNPQAVQIDGAASISQALQLMQHHGVAALVVSKRSERDAFGIILLIDIARQVLAKDRSPDRVNVYEVMSKPVIAIEPDMDIRYCARLFDRFGLSMAPVLDQGEVIGMISYTELVFNGLCKMDDTP